MESLITLAPKLTILKINPIELLTPQAPRGAFNFASLAKSLILSQRTYVESLVTQD